LAPLCTVPSLRGVEEWLERGNKYFYRHPPQHPFDGVRLLECFRLDRSMKEFIEGREFIESKEASIENLHESDSAINKLGQSSRELLGESFILTSPTTEDYAAVILDWLRSGRKSESLIRISCSMKSAITLAAGSQRCWLYVGVTSTRLTA
jgi:hypothetical protein